MAELQDLLERMADDAGPGRGAGVVFDRAIETYAPRILRTRRRGRAVIAIAAVGVVATGALVLANRSDNRHVVVSETPTTSSTATTVPDLTGLSRIGTPVLAAAGGTLWVTGVASGEGPTALYQIDEATNRAIASVPLPDNSPYQVVPGAGAGAGAGDVWVASQQGEQSAHIFKIDAASHRVVATIPTTKDAQLAVTSTDVWAVDGSGVLLRIDPTTARVTQSITLPGGDYAAKFVTAGPLGVWLSNPYDGSISRLDPATGSIRTVVHEGTSAGPLLEAGGNVWVLDNGGVNSTLVAVSPATGQIVDTIGLANHVVAFSTTGQDLWLAVTGAPQLLEYVTASQGYGSTALVHVDPVSGYTWPVNPARGIGAFPSAVTFDTATGTLWAAANVEGTLNLVRSA